MFLPILSHYAKVCCDINCRSVKAKLYISPFSAVLGNQCVDFQNINFESLFNSLLDLCYTADGRLGAALNQHQKIWDIAAPWLIIREAGGMVTGMDGEAVDFRVDDTDFDRDFATVAASPGLHTEIMGLLNRSSL